MPFCKYQLWAALRLKSKALASYFKERKDIQRDYNNVREHDTFSLFSFKLL